MDAYTTALTLLSRRELSVAQLRARLLRRQFAPPDIDEVVARLIRDRTLDDRRVALASARMEAAIKRRGRRRVLQQVQRQGVSAELAERAVAEVFATLDETALLDQAIERRLRGASAGTLDQRAKGRLVRGLVGQGFGIAQILARLRRKRDESDE